MAFEQKKEKKDVMAKCHIERIQIDNNNNHKNEDNLCSQYLS